MSRSAARLSVSFALLVLAAVPASAQYIYGASEILLNSGTAYGHSLTALDYTACYYYDAAVAGGLYEDSTGVSGGSYHGVCTADVYTSGTIHDDRIYTEVSDHYVIAYFYYSPYGAYYDPFGVSQYSSGGSGGGFSFYGCSCPYYVIQQSFYLGSTQVGVQGPCNKTPTLGGPSAVTRGSDATFTVGNLCKTYTVRDWSFTDGSTTVNRGSSGAISWPGKMVRSGTVRTTVVQGGSTYPLSKAVTVNPRTSFAFTAKPATKYANGTFTCDGTPLVVPDPPTQPGQEIGMAIACLRYSFSFTPIGDAGPNKGYWYVTSASDSLSGAVPPATTFAWTITPQLDDPSSAFY